MKKIISLVLSAVLLFSAMTTLSGCDDKNQKYIDKSDIMGSGASDYTTTRDVSNRDITFVEMCVEDYGRLVILLDATTVPITVANFLSLVESGFYNGLTFHRIIEDFMVQGGDPDADGSGNGPNRINGEFANNGHPNDIDHLRGVISMARSTDKNSASCQFFICHADSPHLNGDYAAFGYVVEGMSVIDEIVTQTMINCQNYFGSQNFYYWLYYGNGSLTNNYGPIKELQPVIKYIKVIDYELK